MSPRPTFTLTEARQVAAAYDEGINTSILARHYRCDRKTILRAVHAGGGTLRHVGAPKAIGTEEYNQSKPTKPRDPYLARLQEMHPNGGRW